DGGLGPVRPRGGEVPVTPRRVLHLDLDGDGGEVGVAEGAAGVGELVFDEAADAAGEREAGAFEGDDHGEAGRASAARAPRDAGARVDGGGRGRLPGRRGR